MNYKLGKFLRFFIEKTIHALEPNAILENSSFPWAKQVESFHEGIRAEAENVLKNLSSVVNFNDVIPNQRVLKQDDKWKSFFFIGLGDDIETHQRICPQTTAALQKIPNIINAFYSILTPDVHIPEHRGPYAGILRYHLGIIIPDGDVGIKVNNIVCRWKEGQSLFFDDSFPHEAWNHAGSVRVVLFVDLVRPLPWPLSVLNRIVLFSFRSSKAALNARDAVFNNQVGG